MATVIETVTRALHHGTPPVGSLTTVWTPPATGCVSGAYYYAESCVPSGSLYVSLSLPSRYFSPAICPSGMTSAAPIPTSYAGPPLEPDETGMMCCPSSRRYSVITDTSTTTSILPHCGTTWLTTNWIYLSSCGLSLCFTTSSFLSTYSASDWGYAIQVRWASTDLPSLETDPLNPGAKPTWSTTTSAAPTVTVTQAPASNGLNTGAKAGIGAGVGFVALLLLGFVIMMIRRRRREPSPGFGAAQPVARNDMQPFMVGSAVVQDVSVPMSPAPLYSQHNTMSQPRLSTSPVGNEKGQMYLSGNSGYGA